MQTDQRCGTCKWFRPHNASDRLGVCSWSDADLKLPLCVYLSRDPIEPDETECPCWEARTDAKG